MAYNVSFHAIFMKGYLVIVLTILNIIFFPLQILQYSK
jgi:hypothetical protein